MFIFVRVGCVCEVHTVVDFTGEMDYTSNNWLVV
jgi:hypothetical protein